MPCLLKMPACCPSAGAASSQLPCIPMATRNVSCAYTGRPKASIAASATTTQGPSPLAASCRMDIPSVRTCPSFHRSPDAARHLAPALHLALEEGRCFRARHDQRLETGRAQFLLHVRLLEDGIDLRIELVEDRRRRLGGSEEADP